MKALKTVGIILLVIFAVALMVFVLSPLFAVMDTLLGMKPVIICAALLILGFVFSVIIKNPYLQRLFGFLVGAAVFAVIFYFVCEPVLGFMIPAGAIIGITVLLGFAVWLTSVASNIPLLGTKLITPIWIITVTAAVIIFVTNLPK